jgi:hypothetical protein
VRACHLAISLIFLRLPGSRRLSIGGAKPDQALALPHQRYLNRIDRVGCYPLLPRRTGRHTRWCSWEVESYLDTGNSAAFESSIVSTVLGPNVVRRAAASAAGAKRVEPHAGGKSGFKATGLPPSVNAPRFPVSR